MDPNGEIRDERSIEQHVMEIIRLLLIDLGHQRVFPNITLQVSLERDLGLGSLERVELLSRIERAFSVRFPDRLIAEAETPADLARAVWFCNAATMEKSPLESAASSVARPSEGYPQSSAISTLPPPSGFFCGYPSPLTLVAALQLYAQQNPSRPHTTLYCEGQKTVELNYGTIYEKSQMAAVSMLNRGLKRGQTVALMLPTGEEFLFTFLGVWLAGGVPVPIYPPLKTSRLEEYARRQTRILQNAQARFLVTFQEAELLGRVLSPAVSSPLEVLTPHSLSDPAEKYLARAPEPVDLALIQYTSGSTGHPKGVALSHASLIANIQAIGQTIEVRPSDVGVSWLPLYHDMGLIGAWLFCLYYGIPISILSPLDFLSRPERWLWTIHYTRATLSAAPNFAYELCAGRIREESLSGLDLSCWRAALNGAEPVSPQTLERFSRRMAKYGFSNEALMPVYGLAECSVALTIPPLGRGPRIESLSREELGRNRIARLSCPSDVNPLQCVSVGLPIRAHQVCIVDEGGNILPERYEGRIQFRGPSMMQGYYGNEDATRQVYREGWIDTGDLGYTSEDELFVTGRSKDVILKGGRNLYPQEIEEITGEVAGVRRGCVAAFGVSNLRTGTEQVVVVAETRLDRKGDRQQLVASIIAHLDSSLGMPPDIVELVSPHQVPKTSSGKIQRNTCRSLYLAGSLARKHRLAWLQALHLGALWLKAKTPALPGRMAQLLYGGYAWLVLATIGIPAWLYVRFFSKTRSPHRARAVFRLGCRWVLFFAGLRPKLEGGELLREAEERSSAGGGLLLVSNHSSYLDPLVLGAALPLDFRFVVKSEAASWPIVGVFIRCCDFLPVKRDDPAQATSDLERIGAALIRGEAVHMFPEGTFTRASGIRPLQMGALQLAAETACPILPVTLQGVRDVLRDGTWFPRRKLIRVVVGAMISPQGKGTQEQVRLREAVRQEFLCHCGEGSLDLILAGPPRAETFSQ